MKVLAYPDNETDNSHGPIGRFLKDLQKNHVQLWSTVNSLLDKVKRKSNLDEYFATEWVKRLPKTKEKLFEFRIPPTRRGGVVRIYFGFKKDDPSTVILLSAELKKGKKANKEQIKLAEKRYIEVCK